MERDYSKFPIINSKKTAKNIQTAMRNAGMTPTEVSRVFGYQSCHTICEWTKGRAVPRVENLVVLSWLFGVPIEELVEVEWIDNEWM